MNLTNELKNKLGNAKTDSEIKAILDETKKQVEDAGMILDDADLDQAAGGIWGRHDYDTQYNPYLP